VRPPRNRLADASVGVAPNVDHLRAVDHLHVQRAVALAQGR
jgi:hypothetical protein